MVIQERFEVEAAESGFLQAFPAGGGFGSFMVVHFAAGNFQGEVVDQQAKLADQEDGVVLEQQNAGAGAKMGDVESLGKAGKLNLDAGNLEEGVLVNELGRADFWFVHKGGSRGRRFGGHTSQLILEAGDRASQDFFGFVRQVHQRDWRRRVGLMFFQQRRPVFPFWR